MKITMYELLGMVKDGKAPKKIKYREMIYHICYEYGDYESDIEEYRFGDTKEHYYLFEGIDMLKCLNNEVEILEEEKKIPEKIENISEIKSVGCKIEINIAGNKTLFDTDTPIVTEHCIFKINQLIKNQKKIIDYLKSKEKGE